MDKNSSLVQQPRNYFDIAQLQDPGVLEDFLEQPLTFIAETITGALAVGKTGVMVAGGRVVQALMKGMLFKQWSAEFRQLREAGKIPDDFAQKPYGFQTWVELMTILDEEAPDADRLRALKAMFFAVNKVNVTDAEQMSAYQLWQIAKRLGSGELHLLKVIYEHRHNNIDVPSTPSITFHNWASYMANAAGHGIVGLVELHEKKLTELSLISGRPNNRPDLVLRANARLTDLGMRFYENIQTYELATHDPSSNAANDV